MNGNVSGNTNSDVFSSFRFRVSLGNNKIWSPSRKETVTGMQMTGDDWEFWSCRFMESPRTWRHLRLKTVILVSALLWWIHHCTGNHSLEIWSHFRTDSFFISFNIPYKVLQIPSPIHCINFNPYLPICYTKVCWLNLLRFAELCFPLHARCEVRNT